MRTEDKLTAKENILLLIKELNALVTSLPENIATSPVIEIDLIKENLRKLYAAFLIDRDNVPVSFPLMQNQDTETNSPAENPPVTAEMHSPGFSGEVISALIKNQGIKSDERLQNDLPAESPSAETHPPMTISLFTEAAAVHNSASQQVMEKVNTSNIPETKSILENKAIGKNTIEERISQLRASALFEEPSTLANRYAANETIGDKITRSRTEKSLGEQLQKQPLTDLKRSIGINERYSFINELFGGDQQFYLQSIEQLNKMQDFEEAKKLINETLTKKLNWDQESVLFMKFEELIKRRFNV